MLDYAQPTSITPKFSGDGANIAASATIVFLTFSFPGLKENVLSAAGKKKCTCTAMQYKLIKNIHATMKQHLCGQRNTTSLRLASSQEAARRSHRGSFCVCGVKIVFGSEYTVCFWTLNCSIHISFFNYMQFFAIMTGYKANSTHACVWCTVTRSNIVCIHGKYVYSTLPLGNEREIVKEETALRKEKEAVCCYVHVDVHV